MSTGNALTIKNYDGVILGTITVKGGDLAASTPGLQDIADSWLHSGDGDAVAVLRSRDGWQNGYLFASSDPDAAVV